MTLLILLLPPPIFFHHCEKVPSNETSKTWFKVMLKTLGYKYIQNIQETHAIAVILCFAHPLHPESC